MSDLEVRIIKLEPMRLASFWGFGESPETIAWEKLISWAKPKGLLENPPPLAQQPSASVPRRLSLRTDAWAHPQPNSPPRPHRSPPLRQRPHSPPLTTQDRALPR